MNKSFIIVGFASLALCLPVKLLADPPALTSENVIESCLRLKSAGARYAFKSVFSEGFPGKLKGTNGFWFVYSKKLYFAARPPKSRESGAGFPTGLLQLPGGSGYALVTFYEFEGMQSQSDFVLGEGIRGDYSGIPDVLVPKHVPNNNLTALAHLQASVAPLASNIVERHLLWNYKQVRSLRQEENKIRDDLTVWQERLLNVDAFMALTELPPLDQILEELDACISTLGPYAVQLQNARDQLAKESEIWNAAYRTGKLLIQKKEEIRATVLDFANEKK